MANDPITAETFYMDCFVQGIIADMENMLAPTVASHARIYASVLQANNPERDHNLDGVRDAVPFRAAIREAKKDVDMKAMLAAKDQWQGTDMGRDIEKRMNELGRPYGEIKVMWETMNELTLQSENLGYDGTVEWLKKKYHTEVEMAAIKFVFPNMPDALAKTMAEEIVDGKSKWKV